MPLRLVCWNLHGNNRGANPDAWAYLEDVLRADIALVQEAIVPEEWSGSARNVQQNGKRKWATAVVRRSVGLHPLTSVAALGHTHSLVGPYSGAMAAATATIGSRDVVFVSVHALVVAGYSLKNVHTILNDLVPLMGESFDTEFVVGGDINNGDQLPARNRLLPRHRNPMERFSSIGLTNLVTGGPLAACGLRQSRVHTRPYPSLPGRRPQLRIRPTTSARQVASRARQRLTNRPDPPGSAITSPSSSTSKSGEFRPTEWRSGSAG